MIGWKVRGGKGRTGKGKQAENKLEKAKGRNIKRQRGEEGRKTEK